MNGGNQTQPTQTTTTEMSPEQRKLWGLAFPGIRDFAATVPERYPGSTIAGFDPLQTKGQNMALDASGLQQYLTSNAVQTNKFLLGDIWNPKSNPALQGAIDASVRPITQQYQEVVQPGLRDEFQQAGQQFGGSRRGVAEGIAGREYLNTVGDTSSKLVQNQYANNLDAMVKGLGLVPQTTQAALQPAMTVSGVGDIRQRMAQALLGEKANNFQYDQYAPFLQSKELLSLLGGLPGGTTTSTANNPPQAPWWQQALGGGMMAASMGGSQGLAGLLPFLSAFSDRRLKRDIMEIGRGILDLPMYVFRYIAGGPMLLGFMADDVEKVLPQAVSIHGGYKAVNYSLILGDDHV